MTEPVVRVTLLDQPLGDMLTGAVQVRRITLQPDVVGGPHHHNGPVFGTVEAGSVVFQVDGGDETVLRAGDVFYEPANVLIDKFDATGEGVTFVGYFLSGPNERPILTPGPPVAAAEVHHQRRRPDVSDVELIGGPERVEVALHDYDARWVSVFREHERRIRNALAGAGGRAGAGAGAGGRANPVTDVAIEHIGSTAVPGLAAKPIVDIVVVVQDITAEEDYLDALLAAGYRLRVREPGHRLVRTPARDVHVHLYERGDPAVGEYLLLRDRLRSDADDRALYERTKRALLDEQWDDMNDYAEAKGDVIQEIKARARAVRVASR